MSQHLTDEQLDQIEQTAKEARRSLWSWPTYDDLEQVNAHMGAHARHIATMDPATTLQLIAEVKELRAQIAAVRAEHQPFQCSECERLGAADGCVVCPDEMGWPCDTIKAIGGPS